MSRIKSLRRYAVPIAVGSGALLVAAGTGIFLAGAEDLPDRSAEELLEAVQNADVDGYTGVVEQTSDLGLPELGADSVNPASLSAGTHTLGVWYDSSGNVRTSVEGDLAEASIIRNGSDMWAWNSDLGLANHYELTDGLTDLPGGLPSVLSGGSAAPSSAADAVLAAVGDTTELKTDGVEEIAGRDAYGLILTPKGDSLVDAVRLSVDADTGLPLQTQIFSQGKETPAFESVFNELDLEVPDPEVFEFEPPEGAEVVESLASDVVGSIQGVAGGGAETYGSGFETIAVSDIDEQALRDELAKLGVDEAAIDQALANLEPVSGDWGSGKLLSTDLFSALLTDDGQLAVGSVAPEALYEVL
ncbi:MAG: LolA family protein [Stackebrandtia sp.]